MKNNLKIPFLIISVIIFLYACGSDTDKFLKGTWESKEKPEHTITFDGDELTRDNGSYKFDKKYEIQDAIEDIIYIETEPSKETKNSTVYRFQKEGEKLLFLDYWVLDSSGEEIPGSTTDMQYEELEKVSGGGGTPKWVYVVGFIFIVGMYFRWRRSN